MSDFAARTGRRGRRLIRFLFGKELLQGRQLRARAERHGSGYGGWMVACDTLDSASVVYSVGVGDDITFDLSLIQRYGLTVHAFDPTPRSIEWIKKQTLPNQFVFHSIGLAGFDGTAMFHPPSNPEFVSYSLVEGAVEAIPHSVEAPVRRLGSLMNELGHRRIDLLKMDIEGAEYEVIQDLLSQHLPVRQILVEFHHRLPHVGVQKT